jgi:DNA-binding NtrC family response regulator
MRNRILLVDDEVVRFTVRDHLRARGYEISEAENLAQALAKFESSRPDLVITDYSLPDGNGLELLQHMREIDSAVPGIMLTGFGSIELAVDAIKKGAEHFLTKPVRLDTLAVIVERTLSNERVKQKDRARTIKLESGEPDPFLGDSDAVRRLRDEVQKILTSDMTVLIQGETGTGKGVLANYLYRHGPRSDEAFVDLNCAGLSKDLLESELFGYEKGAFTGANASKPGLLEVADRGTAFLDEIGDVDLAIQAKLLKVVEDKKFRHLGDVKDRRVDVRLIAATHQDLPKLVREKRFRSDLYYRLSPLPIHLAPLRQRREDIPLLIAQLLSSISKELGRKQIEVTEHAIKRLSSHDWPGNVRELKNVLERAVLLSDGKELTERYLNFGYDMELPEGLSGTIAEMERALIESTLARESNISVAAERLGISRSSLYKKIKEYSITSQDTASGNADVR